jgi:small GTP-binding protein
MEVLQVKVILLGQTNVGKSSILYRYITGDYKDDLSPTIGANFLGKLIKFPTKAVKLNIWDTAGQERYNTFARMYCRDANAVIFVFQAGDLQSFHGLSQWNQLVNDSGVDQNVKIYVVSNKADLFRYEELPESVIEFVRVLNAEFFQVSAKLDVGIRELFETVAKDAVSGGEKVRSSMFLNRKRSVLVKEVKKKKCC